MADRLEYPIEARPEGFISGVSRATKAAQEFDGSVEAITTSSKGLERATGKTGAGVRQFSYILNDMQQFSLGASAGVRAISNNLGILAMSMGVGGAAILAIEAGATAAAFFGDQLFRADDAAQKVKGTLKELIKVTRDYANYGIGSVAEGEARIAAARTLMAEQDAIAGTKLTRYAGGMSASTRGGPIGGFLAAFFPADSVEAAGQERKLWQQRIKSIQEIVDGMKRMEQEEEALKKIGFEEVKDEKDLEKIEREREKNLLRRIQLRQFEAQVIARSTKGFLKGTQDIATNPSGLAMRRDVFGRDQYAVGSGQMNTLSGAVASEMGGISAAFQHELSTMETSWKGWANNFVRDHGLTMETVGKGFMHFADAAQFAFDASGRHAKEFYGFYQAFAIAEAIMNTYTGATKALAQGGIFGPFLAAGVIASGMGMVAKIASTQPGSSSSGGGMAAGSFAPMGITGSRDNPRGVFVGSSPHMQAPVIMETRVVGEDIYLSQRMVHSRHVAAGRTS